MTGDDLRDLLAVAMYEKTYDALPRDSQVVLVDAAFDGMTEAAADPVRRLAILNLIGDVTEGVLIEPTDFTMWSVRPAISGVTLWPSVPVFVVRPRGEATMPTLDEPAARAVAPVEPHTYIRPRGEAT